MVPAGGCCPGKVWHWRLPGATGISGHQRKRKPQGVHLRLEELLLFGESTANPAPWKRYRCPGGRGLSLQVHSRKNSLSREENWQTAQSAQEPSFPWSERKRNHRRCELLPLAQPRSALPSTNRDGKSAESLGPA